MEIDWTAIITALLLAAGSGGGLKVWLDYKIKKGSSNSDETAESVRKVLEESVMPHFELMEKSINNQIQSCITCKDKIAKNRLENSHVSNTINNSTYYLKERFLFDLVFILQPIPQDGATHLSVFYEAKREGIQSATTQIKNMPIKEIGSAYNTMCMGNFFIFDDINRIKDKNIKGIIFRLGGKNAVCKSMTNSSGVVTGFLIGINMGVDIKTVNRSELEKEFTDEAVTIQGIIPDIEQS